MRLEPERREVMELDKSGLDSRVFNAFAETSRHLYIYLCNMQTNVSRWSRFAVEYFGLPGEYMENAGVIWEEHIHPEDRLMYHNDIEAVFSGKRKTGCVFLRHFKDKRNHNVRGIEAKNVKL